jgi:hypothetical protein
MFAGQLTCYTTRHTKISYSLAYQCSLLNLHATPSDTPRSVTASHINVRRSTYLLYHQTHQDQRQPRISMFATQLTSCTTRHTKISYSLAYQCSLLNLPPAPPDIPRSVTALHVNIRRLTYNLHHQTHQDQLQARMSIFAGQLTTYTTRHTKISYRLAYQYSQVNSPPTPPDMPKSATASHINVRRSTYNLHHQTPRLATASHINVYRSTHHLHHQTRHTKISYRLACHYLQVNLPPIIMLINTNNKSYIFLLTL